MNEIVVLSNICRYALSLSIKYKGLSTTEDGDPQYHQRLPDLVTSLILLTVANDKGVLLDLVASLLKDLSGNAITGSIE
jgi:hypothetical protein